MDRMFYTDDAAGHHQRELDQTEALGDSLDRLCDVLNRSLAPALAREEAVGFAKMEFYESCGYWPTDEQLHRSGIPIRPLPPLPDSPSV